MIKFGTDGWRGIINDDFNLENIRDVAQALCDYLNDSGCAGTNIDSKETGNFRPKLVIGYDTRLFSEEFAKEVALVAAANNIDVYLMDRFAPTAAASYFTLDMKADGGVVITASHNPPRYGGLKFKGPYGGSATPEITHQIEEYYKRNQKEKKKPAAISEEQAKESGRLHIFNPKEEYLSFILDFMNTDLLSERQSKKIRVVADPLYGAGQGYLKEALQRLECDVTQIHDGIDTEFGGLNPEPFGSNLKDLKECVIERKYDVGIALDGDADRIGAIDASGAFINSHQIFALLLEHLINKRKWHGDIVKSVSMTQMIDIIADENGLKVYETPVGFKHVCGYMLKNNILIGGEESGGLGIKNFIPERDGILIGLLLVEIMLVNGKTLGQLIDELMDRIGHFYYDRWDVKINSSAKTALFEYLGKYDPNKLAGRSVSSINKRDGYKYCLKGSEWLMIRPSGTEDVVRLYAEAESPERVNELLKAGKQILDSASDIS